MTRKLLLILLLSFSVTGCLVVGADHREQETVEKTLALEPGGLIKLTNYNGSIEVRSWNRSEVHLVAIKRASGNNREQALDRLKDTKVEIDESADRIEIRTRTPKSRGWFENGGASVRYELTVPEVVALDLRSTNGRISIEDIQGRVEAGTTNGKLELSGIRGSFDIGTTNGPIEAELLEHSGTDDVEASTTNGSVRIALPSGIQADLRVSTTNGRIRTDFPVEVTSRGRKINDKLNGGGPRIRISTTNGSVRIDEAR